MKRISAVLCAGIMLGTVGSLAACTPESNDNSSEIDPNIFAVYTAYAEEAGDNALSYADWYADLLAHAKGEKGDKGDNGANGKSAFELWLEQDGNAGKTEEDFFAFLKGEKGDPGDDGDPGDPGNNGKSAFEVWLEQDGNAGKTEDDFFAFLKGEKGDPGDDGDPGDPGKAGSQWYSFETVPENTVGNDGDFCIVTSTSQIYKKEAGRWIIILNFPMSGAEIKNDDTFKIPDEGPGYYKVLLMTRDTELSAELLAKLTVTAENIDSQYVANASPFEKSVESTPGNNIYYAVIPQLTTASNYSMFGSDKNVYLADKEREVKFSGIDGTLNAKVQIEKWTPPTLTALDAEFDWFYIPKYLNTGAQPTDYMTAYNDEYYSFGDATTMQTAKCTGAAVFFDPLLYETISRATLKFEYGAGAVQKFSEEAVKSGSSSNNIVLWATNSNSLASISGSSNNMKLSEFLTNGFQYLNISSSSNKYFIEIIPVNTMISVTTNVPVRVKLTKVSS